MKGQVPQQIMQQIDEMLQNIRYGSIEIYVVDGEVTQMTERRILKTKATKSNGYAHGK